MLYLNRLGISRSCVVQGPVVGYRGKVLVRLFLDLRWRKLKTDSTGIILIQVNIYIKYLNPSRESDHQLIDVRLR